MLGAVAHLKPSQCRLFGGIIRTNESQLYWPRGNDLGVVGPHAEHMEDLVLGVMDLQAEAAGLIASAGV